MNFRTALVGIFLLLIMYGCGFEERRKELDTREQSLVTREQAVMLKEKQLQLLEDSLRKTSDKNDSTNLPQIQGLPFPDSLAGNWNVNMVCTQTNCSGFAVGDIRKEQWQLAKNETGVSVRAMQGDKLIRVYTGIFTGENLRLSTPASDSIRTTAKMTVALKIDNINKMSGQRSITQSDGCGATFKVDMDKERN